MSQRKEIDYTLVWGVRTGMYIQVKEQIKLMQKEGWKCKGGLVIMPSTINESSCFQTMVKLEEEK